MRFQLLRRCLLVEQRYRNNVSVRFPFGIDGPYKYQSQWRFGG